ncbi:MAG: hypothetical protein KatS3mg016_2333 [Fimbriimonadales bacterium]|nr:MAG: hypothetical protein KatS3mg016_2333 [Fimbriimonadales bacterium]GIV07768.1 MAG: hypothetical protein KatS3mg017_0970 [Fimbriimonadales bacterium]
MWTRSHSGKVHWVFVLFIALVAVFLVMALAPVVGNLRQPPYVVKAMQFMEHIRLNQFEEAKKLLDSESVPKEKRDPKQVLEQRMPILGPIEKVSLVEVVENPSDLKHPKASEGVRVDLHMQCYLAQGSAFIYLVPKGGDWVIVDYTIQ